MELKYQAQTAAIPSCPPRSASPRQGTFARLLFAVPSHPDNFRPPAAINPTREFDTDNRRCDAWGLSMFETGDQLEAFVRGIGPKYRRLLAKIGTHLGMVCIRESDGLATLVDQKGHFSLHESSGTNWDGRYSVVRAL